MYHYHRNNYDNCYDSDAEEAYAEDLTKTNLEIKIRLIGLDLEDKKLILRFVKNIEAYKSFFEIIKINSK